MLYFNYSVDGDIIHINVCEVCVVSYIYIRLDENFIYMNELHDLVNVVATFSVRRSDLAKHCRAVSWVWCSLVVIPLTS